MVVIFSVWGGFFLIASLFALCGRIDRIGQLGDSFNILNALFSGLAFAVVYLSLETQKQQIRESKEAQNRSALIAGLTAQIQWTLDKINSEKVHLYAVEPSFKNISFLHKGDGTKTAASIKAREEHAVALEDFIEVMKNIENPTQGFASEISKTYQDLAKLTPALPMLRQLKKLNEKLFESEEKLENLLADA